MLERLRNSAGRWLVPVALACACAAVYVVPAMDMPFYTKGEAREAVLVQAMHDGGNYVLPLRNGTEIPSKPPLFHWLASLVAWWQGHVTETGVRIPSILAAAVVVCATGTIARAFFAPASAAIAAVVLGSSVTFFVSATAGRVDMVLAAAVTVALAFFAIDYFGARRGLATGFHAATAAAVLAKGPVGFLLPWSVVVTALLSFRDREYARSLRPSQALFWLVAPGAWYLAAYTQAGDAFLAKQLLQENFQRLLDAEGGGTGHVKPFYAHIPLLVGGFSPWSLMLPVAVAFAVPESLTARSKPLRFLLLWLFVPLVLVSCAGSKRAVYMLPSYPAMALLVAWWWTTEQGWTQSAISRSRAWWRAAGVATAGVLGLAFSVVLAQLSGVPVARVVAAFMSEGDQANLAAILDRIETVRPAALVLIATCLAAVLAFGMAVSRQRRLAAAAAAAVLATVAIAGGSATFQRVVADSQSVAPFVRGVRADATDVRDWFFFRAVSYPVAFYAGRPVPRIDDLGEVGDSVVFAHGDDEAALLEAIAMADRTWEAIGRFTYGDNPRRESLVAIRTGTKSR
jgi:4-amino-4-deoxy-L-arabinose transferase-like glycosyltransferase